MTVRTLNLNERTYVSKTTVSVVVIRSAVEKQFVIHYEFNQ